MFKIINGTYTYARNINELYRRLANDGMRYIGLLDELDAMQPGDSMDFYAVTIVRDA